METERKLVVSIDAQGNKYLTGINMSVSVTKVETEEQRRIAALEEQISQLSTQIASLTYAQERQHFKRVRDSVIDSVSRALDHQFSPKRP